jgi:FHS family L-fucose permease-like MFS transporter
MASTPISGTTNTQGGTGTSQNFAFTALTALFFMWGFLTSLNDILIPHLKAVFDLTYLQASLIQFTFFSAYFIMSIPSGKIIEKIGYKNGVVVGLATAGVGALLFYPAASLPSYGVFLSALFILATGITILQVAANPYVSILGKPETASSRLNLSQAFNSLGTTIAPYFGGLLILSASALSIEQIANLSGAELQAYKLQEAASVQGPYLGLGITLFVMAIVFAFLKLPNINESEEQGEPHTFADVLKVSHLKFAVIAIFVYVGAEVSIGSYLVNFIALPEIAGLSEQQASVFVSLYWGGAMIGRFLGSISMSAIQDTSKKLLYSGAIFAFAFLLGWFFTKDVSRALIFVGFVIVNYGAFMLAKGMPGKTLGTLALGASILVVITTFMSGMTAVWTIISVGLFNSIMFPTIFTLGIKDLGKYTSKGSSLLIMAIVGGAILPVAMGAMADTIGIQMAFFLPALCYLYIAFFGFKGSEVKSHL